MLRGNKVRSQGALLDHLATAFGFPWYFGDSWDAAVDCLRDQPAVPHLLIVTRASELLTDAEPRDLGVLCRIVAQLADEPDGPSAFHLLCQDSPAELAQLERRLAAERIDTTEL